MATSLLLGRLLLACVFGVAAAAKLFDRTASRTAIAAFGVPSALAGPAATILPLVELALALALFSATAAWWGALGALCVLLLFTAAIGFNLARGRASDCHCFGQLHSGRIGPATLARNAALTALAGLVVWFGRVDAGPSVIGGLADLSAAPWAPLAIALAALLLGLGLSLVVVQLVAQNGRLLVRLDALDAQLHAAGASPVMATTDAGLPVGRPAPRFSAPDLEGTSVSLDVLRSSGRAVLLVFTDPGCPPCSNLLPELGRWQRELAEHFTLALVSRGDAQANRLKAAEHGLERVLLQLDHDVSTAYHAYATPSAVLVAADGSIASPLAAGADAIRALIDTIGMRPTLPDRVRPGIPEEARR